MADTAPKTTTPLRVINLNTELVISEENWTLNYGIEGRAEIEADVRSWARNALTEHLRAVGVDGYAR